MIQTMKASLECRDPVTRVRNSIRIRALCYAVAQLTGASLAIAFVGCCPLARVLMMVRMEARIEHADGTPARAVALWYVDRALKPGERTPQRKEPVCRTDSTGSCTAVLTYHYCEWVCPWDEPPQPEYAGRFEIVTTQNGMRQSLGFLQGVRRRGAFLEGTLWVRVD
jgi:hypothetical protein